MRARVFAEVAPGKRPYLANETDEMELLVHINLDAVRAYPSTALASTAEVCVALGPNAAAPRRAQHAHASRRVIYDTYSVARGARAAQPATVWHHERLHVRPALRVQYLQPAVSPTRGCTLRDEYPRVEQQRE